MSGCKSCTDCRTEPSFKSVNKLEKLEKNSRSGNPRYPHIVPGCQAILTDETKQIIVEVLSDNCDEKQDRFTLKIERVLRDTNGNSSEILTLDVDQAAGDSCWKLQALI
ncbi:MAG: hypothetical protein ACLPVO_11220 [Desulfomonilaceae bacterium]|jgi:hypothetical protein